MVVDARARIRDHNPALSLLLGHPRDELLGRTLTDFIHPEDREPLLAFIRERLEESDEAGSLDVRMLGRGPSWRRISLVAATPVPGALVVSGRDETERRLLQAEREQGTRIASLGSLASTVAHEFNNVLMGIQPFAELMQRPGADPKVARAAGYILGSVARGKAVVLDIVRFAQPATPQIRSLALKEWWDEVVPDFQAHTEDNIQFQCSFPGGLNVLADPEQLEQVMSNLVSNARDAMPLGGSLHVQARRPSPHETFPFGVIRDPESYVQISVSDTGTGMSEEARKYAFDPLFTTKQSRGTGLGLAVVHQIVHRHGGSVFAVSEVGAGTTFHLFLPVAP